MRKLPPAYKVSPQCAPQEGGSTTHKFLNVESSTILATHNALKHAKDDVTTAKSSSDAADFTKAANRLNDVEDSLEISLVRQRWSQ